jgi:hypothetical protein
VRRDHTPLSAAGQIGLEVPRLDTMPIDWQERIDAAIESECAYRGGFAAKRMI